MTPADFLAALPQLFLTQISVMCSLALPSFLRATINQVNVFAFTTSHERHWLLPFAAKNLGMENKTFVAFNSEMKLIEPFK